MANLLIADSGSTKTDWCFMETDKSYHQFRTSGMNPLLQTEGQIKKLLALEVEPDFDTRKPDGVVFYGAGVKDDAQKEQLKNLLAVFFECKEVAVYSDLMAAARATCGHAAGVACILGTGSNSGYYNGEIIKHQNPSLGFIVGDEGSGAFLGKRVLQYYFYRTFDGELSTAFEQKYGNDLPAVLEKIYREPFANRYLATFVEFLKEHRGHYMVENIIEDAFIDFHQRHILKYRESWIHPIHFCGSVAYEFRDIIRELHAQYGLETGQILKAPIEGLCRFHEKELLS